MTICCLLSFWRDVNGSLIGGMSGTLGSFMAGEIVGTDALAVAAATDGVALIDRSLAFSAYALLRVPFLVVASELLKRVSLLLILYR